MKWDVTQGLPGCRSPVWASFLHSAFWEPPPKGCISWLHLPELSEGWQDLLGHPGCPCCWLSCFMLRICPHHATPLRCLGPFQSCREAEASARSPQFVPWTRHPGPTIPRQQLLPTGAKLASAHSEMRVGMRIKKLCTHLPTPTQLFSCLQFCSNVPAFHPAVWVKLLFDLFHPIPRNCHSHLAEHSETWDRIPPRQGAGCSLPRSRDGKWQFPKYPGVSGASELAKCGSSSDPHLHMAAVHRCCLINTESGGAGG